MAHAVSKQSPGGHRSGASGDVFYKELWHACAGPTLDMPREGERAYFFTRCRIKQREASTHQGLDQPVPSFNLPSKILCKVMNVQLRAETETDEVYAQITLLPEQYRGEITSPDPPLPKPQRCTVHSFRKILTDSDTSIHPGFLVLGRRHVAECLPPLDMSQDPPCQELVATDLHGNEWHFLHIFRGRPGRHLLTYGWSVFVHSKRLVPGDEFIFLRGENGELRVGVRRHKEGGMLMVPQLGTLSSILSRERMHLGAIAAASHAISTGTHFSVCYIPRYSEPVILATGSSLKSSSLRQHHSGTTTTATGNASYSPKASRKIKFNPTRSRSPTHSPLSKVQTNQPSPIHPRGRGYSPEALRKRQDDRKNKVHPLTLPPSHSNSPPMHLSRNNSANEGVQCLHSRWKKGTLLGGGTFGLVYAGFNSVNGQMCAIKEVRVISDAQNSNECLRQLNQEITLLSRLSHPNIVQYYGSELNDGTLSVYLEYVSGGSIHKLLQEYGPFEEPVIQTYTRQILSGLAYLHARQTIHRDIKGANILVDPNGEIKIADFGVAEHITPSSSVLSFKGSPYWMAPEVIRNHNGYNLAVDIWSLGCTIVEMATSKPPWSQFEAVAAIYNIGSSKGIPPIPDHFSEDGKDFLKLCLQRDPSARPTAAQLLEHPFVYDQATAKLTKISSIRDAMHTNISYMQNKTIFTPTTVFLRV